MEIDRIWASVNHEESVGLRCRIVTVKIRGSIDGGWDLLEDVEMMGGGDGRRKDGYGLVWWV